MKLTCTKPGLGIEVGTQYPVLSENKLAWVIVIGQMEKKVMKSTGLFACAQSRGPSFELVTVTEKQQELSFDEALLAGGGDNDTLPIVTAPIPVRRRGRPATGKALSPAEKQARYRARQAEKTVTVTFNRSDIPALKILLAQADLSQLLPRDELDRLAKAVFDAALK
ncbi:hypothetical protein ACET53_17080 [Aeromonas veronii]